MTKRRTKSPIVKAVKATSDKTRRMRTVSLSDVIRCGFPKCTYTAKNDKTVSAIERRRQKEHNVDPEVTLLDGSVSTSTLDDTAVTSETDNLASGREHSSEFYSDMSKVQQSMQLEARRRRRKDSDSEEEGEDEKRLNMQAEQPEPVMTQSPGKEERDNLYNEVLAALKANADRENLDTSRSLLEETRDVGADSAILDGLNAGDSTQETNTPPTHHNVSQPADSIALNMTELDLEVRNLKDKLALRKRSLEDALAKNAKDKEAKRLSGIIKALKDGLAKPSVAVATKDAKSNECTFKHDIGARKLFHEEKKKQKEEKEKEKEEEKNRKEDTKFEGKGEKARESEEPGNGKRKKKKKSGNKEPKTETTDGKSTAMDADEATISTSNSDANAKTDHQGKVDGAPGPQQSTSKARPPQQAANSRPQPSQQPTIPLNQVATRFQQQIPTSFNFGQQQFPSHRVVTDFKEAPPGLPPGPDPHSWRWRLYEGNFSRWRG